MLVFNMVDAKRFMVGICALVMLSMGVGPVTAKEVRKVAIFPFDMIVERQNNFDLLPPTANEAEKKRLLLLNKKLGELLEASGSFSRVDLSALSEKIEKASPIFECKGCDLEFAKEAGAEISVVGLVRKSTSVLINISIFLREVSSGKVIKAGAVSIRENDDAGWLRGVRYIVRNKILAGLSQ